MFGKQNKPQNRIDSLIGATTRIEGNVFFSGGLRVDGMIRGNYALWRAYFSPDFHPSHQDASHSQDWLQAHTADYRIVGQAAQ